MMSSQIKGFLLVSHDSSEMQAERHIHEQDANRSTRRPMHHNCNVSGAKTGNNLWDGI